LSATAASERRVPLGQLVTTHGLDGWLKLNAFNSDSAALLRARGIFLDKNGVSSAHELESCKPFKKQFLIKLRGVDRIDDAATWVGATLSVSEETLDTLQPGEYYHYQVIGFEVFDLAGERIGVITRTLSTPGGELYVVAGTDKEHLIPAVKQIIEKVDFTAARIIINPPEGLLDL
jgi:16S rRNA processing protein RimM